MARVWLLTVSSPITSRLAMARLDRPATTSPSTSLSRWDRPTRAPGQNSPLSSRAAELLKDDLELLTKAKKKDVEAARKEIVEIALRLEAEGRVDLGRDAE